MNQSDLFWDSFNPCVLVELGAGALIAEKFAIVPPHRAQTFLQRNITGLCFTGSSDPILFGLVAFGLPLPVMRE